MGQIVDLWSIQHSSRAVVVMVSVGKRQAHREPSQLSSRDHECSSASGSMRRQTRETKSKRRVHGGVEGSSWSGKENNDGLVENKGRRGELHARGPKWRVSWSLDAVGDRKRALRAFL